MAPDTPMKFDTRVVRAGIAPDPTTGAIVPPIYQTTTYVLDEVGKDKGFDYTRSTNPTRQVLEANLAAIEGAGVRLSGNTLAYIAWLFALDCLPLLAITLVLRRSTIGQTLRGQWRTGVLGGMLALGAYGLVIWALSLGAMAPIAALRETSVIIAALIGALFLGEPFGRRRVLAATGVAIGVIMLTATAS